MEVGRRKCLIADFALPSPQRKAKNSAEKISFSFLQSTGHIWQEKVWVLLPQHVVKHPTAPRFLTLCVGVMPMRIEEDQAFPGNEARIVSDVVCRVKPKP